jgi:hypothetical protein
MFNDRHNSDQEFESSVEKEAIHPLTNVHMAEKVLQWQSQVKPYHFYTIMMLIHCKKKVIVVPAVPS